ncbi:MAG: hypothetical protein KF718_03570 [Polyangiaceae bacterium]|nr:hypothetical protein [Polyangiaceae bacterium]
MAKVCTSFAGLSLGLLVGGSALANGGGGAVLPLERLRLYETGVGYFERSGAPGVNAVGLPVPTGHLDDALKTLVVLSDDPNAAVTGIEFGSSVSRGMARALAGLGEDGTALDLHTLLRSLKGAEVIVKTKTETTAGRLVEVIDSADSKLETCVRVATDDKEPCVVRKVATLVVVSKDGELRRLQSDDVVSVKPTDKAFVARLGAALDSLSDRSAQMKKEIRVLAKSGKKVRLGYVTETPVWRTTYRLVLGAGGTGTLQGWALLHNDTDEPWRGVQVELVNGQPDSFLFPLAAPRYARRELVTPQNEMSTVPQLMDTTADRLWGDEIGDSFGAGGLGISGVGEGGGGRGEGIGLGTIGTIGHGAGAGGPGASSALSVGNLAGIAQAEGVETGALFRYALPAPVDLRAHGSALVPFLSDGVKARRIASFSAPGAPARSAVFLLHDGKQTLPGGPISVFADGGFAGEASIERMKPKQSTVVEFGFDLDVELTLADSKSEEETRLLGFARGQLVQHYVRRTRLAYALENRSGSPRTVYLALKLVNNAKVTGADELAYDSRAGHALAVFAVGAREQKERRIVAEEGLSRAHAFTALTSASLTTLLKSKVLPEDQRAILREARERLLEAEVRRGGMKRRRAELLETERTITRLREHARAVGGARSDGARQLVERLLAAEDDARRLRARIKELSHEAQARKGAAERALARLGTG